MKAIVQDGYGLAGVLHLREIAKPAVADDQVLVRVRAASANAMDGHFLHPPVAVRVFFGLRRPKVPIRGADLAGVVEAVGKRVTRFRPGDEVFGTARGTFAEYASTREDRLEIKPRGLSFEQAAAIPVAGLTALQGLRDKAKVQPGQRVLIYGAGGGVGTFAVQIAKALGARVTAITSTRNLDLIRSLGPEEVLDYQREDFTRRPERYDVFFDVAANRPLRDCRRVLTPKGCFVAVGAAKGGTGAAVGRMLASFALSFFSQRMKSVMARVRQEDLLALRQLIEAGKVSPVIERTYSLSETPEALQYIASGQARAKVVITVG